MKTKKQNKQTEFALRCFIDGERVKTDKLTKEQAKIFCHTALHLAKYLKNTYLSKD